MREESSQAELLAHDRLQEQPEASRTKRVDCVQCHGPLSGKQARFCSQACNNAWYGARHPRIGIPLPEPGKPRESCRVRLLGIMMDREWHTLLALSMALGEQSQSVSARLRDLRAGGFQIDHRTAKVPYSKHAHEYRLVKP